MMRLIDKIIVHCSATPPDMDIGAPEIRRWHLQRGWKDIGYHVVIRRTGDVNMGRPDKEVGAHTKGQNANSIGICVVGGVNDQGDPDSNFTIDQLIALDRVIRSYKTLYGDISIHGHRDFSPKACPSFDVRALISKNSWGF